jgi:UDP-3-O-[3-hydroxymyristoyl] N-acetylglucosamine deacetylase
LTDLSNALNYSANQGCISQAVSFKGKGLHTGRRVTITIHPAPENTGIRFRRIDKRGINPQGKQTEILAHWKNTKKLPLCTCLVDIDNTVRDVQVRTIEHLMAAFYACGIDNALVEVEGQELPIMDGSSRPFIQKMNGVGVTRQDETRQVFTVTDAIEVQEENRFIKIEPSDKLSMDVTIILANLGRFNWQGDVTPKLFVDEIGSARTFGRLKNGLLAQLTRFNKDPICLGANTKSAVVLLKGKKVLNKEGLRMPDEYVRHRMLDLVGDLMLSGGHIQGKITAHSPAHRLTHELLGKIFEQQAYREL